tara:strand:- start:39 stop:209 length:171 start_codon:yes stop_codon:yes gene_type:complete
MQFAKIPRDETLRISTFNLNSKIIDHCNTLPIKDAMVIRKRWKKLLESLDYNIMFE